MPNKKRFAPKTKAEILRKHIQKKTPISELCEQAGCTPGAVYQWQETLLSRAHMCFETTKGRPVDAKKQSNKIKELEEKLSTKNAIISELMEELLKEKKLGGVI